MPKPHRKPDQITGFPLRPVVACIGILILCLPLLFWCLLDNSIWPWDQSWYGAESVRAFRLLQDSKVNWLENLFTVFGTRAPLIVWVGQFFVPLGLALGKVESGLLLVCVIANFLSLWLTYKWINNAQDSRGVTITTLVFMASAPLFAGMAQNFFVESLQLCVVCMFYYILHESAKQHPIHSLSLLIIACATGMGVKASTPLYVLVPGLLILKNVFSNFCRWNKSKDVFEKPKWALFIFSGLLALFVTGWYAVNLGDLVAFIKSASSGEMALLYGSEKSWVSGVMFWLISLKQAFSLGNFTWFWSIALVTIAGLASYGILSGKPVSILTRPMDKMMLAGMLQAILVIAVFGLQTNEETRYLLPILPSVAACLAGLLSRSKSIITVLLVMIVSLCQWVGTYAVSYNLIAKPGYTSVWLTPLQRASDKKDELARMDDFLQHESLNNRYVFCLVDLKEFNHSSLNFISLTRGYFRETRLIYSLPVWGGSDWQVVADLITSDEVRCPFVLTFENELLEKNVDAFNQTALKMSAWVAESPDFSRVDFPNSQGIVIYRNIRFYPEANQIGFME